MNVKIVSVATHSRLLKVAAVSYIGLSVPKTFTPFDSAKALENSKDENGELQVANAPKRRVKTETEQPEQKRRVSEYKVISTDN